MGRSLLARSFILSVLAIFGLSLLACTSQTPVSGPATSPQVNSVSTAVVNGQNQLESNEPATAEMPAEPQTAESLEPSQADTPVETVAPASVETVQQQPESTPQQQPVVAAAESPETAITVEAPAEVPADAEEPDGVPTLQAHDGDGHGKGTAGIVAYGSGRASSAPDLATLRLGVEAIAATVGEARTAAAKSMTAIMDSVQEHGVADSDIQTGYFSIHPRYTGREITRCIGGEDSGEKGEGADETATTGALQEGPVSKGSSLASQAQECFQEYQSVITGYQVSNNVTVLVRDLDTIDDVIDDAVAAGGNNIRFNGLSFSLEDTADLEVEARADAVAELQEKAAELASLAGVELGDLIYLTESGGAQPPEVRAEFALARAALAYDEGPSTPISPGEVVVQVKVFGQYLIVQPE